MHLKLGRKWLSAQCSILDLLFRFTRTADDFVKRASAVIFNLLEEHGIELIVRRQRLWDSISSGLRECFCSS